MDNMKKINLTKTLAVFATASLLFASCERIDEDNDAKEQPRFWLKIFVENQSKPAESKSRAGMQQEPETFTFNIGEDNDCEMTCLVTDMEGYAPISATRGMPVGTTVGLTINGTTFAAPQTNPIESANAYGTAGIKVTAYQKDNKGSAPAILTPNSKTTNAAAENAASVATFQNLTFTWDATKFNNTGSWVTTSNISGYYWHETDSLSFFTYAPTTLGATYNAATRQGTFSYTCPTDNASQKDVLIGATPFAPQPPIDKTADGTTKPTYEINVSTFHALCAVRFVIDNMEKGTAPNYTQRPKEFKIKSIVLTNLNTGGTCTYTYNKDTSKHSADCIAWSSLTGAGTYTGTYDKAIAKTNATYNLHSTDGTASGTQDATSFLLIPQELAENCKVTINYTYDAYEYNTSGVQTIVPTECSITGQLVGSGATKDAGGSYTSYGSWEPGKMYTYVIESKNIKRQGVLYKINGTINFDSGSSSQPNSDASWWSVTDFASPASTLTYARGQNSPGAFSIDVSDIKYIELSWSDQTKKFCNHVAEYPNPAYEVHAHIWLEGDLLAGGYHINGITGTTGHNGTGTDHVNNPDKTITNYSYKDPVTGTLIGPKDYTDVYMYENIVRTTSPAPTDGTSYNHKWVFDVSEYSTIKIPAYFWNKKTGGGSCKWDLTNFQVAAIEFMPW